MFLAGKTGAALPDWVPPPLPAHAPMRGNWVELVPLRVEHTVGLFREWRDDPDLWTYMFSGPYDSEASLRSWIASVQDSKDPMFFTLVLPDGRLGGVASFMRITPKDGVIEVGNICFARSLQGTPAATEAMALMASQAFDLGYRRYEWKCNSHNISSRRAAQRLGFSFEGIFRQHMIAKGGNRDTAWFSMIDSEWPQIRAAHEAWLAPGNFDGKGRQRVALSDLTRGVLAARDPILG